ncbi:MULTISPECIES: hypothetical protein [Cobetia]|uniref:hypothetical protein n=1 Tax=Cobetia TaxID=204286 RepID=UPI00046A428E|nr:MULTISPECIES: hypothetical protein [Cobetia]
MLNKAAVSLEEERLRSEINQLDSEQRKEFYSKAKERLKDPDTYAVLSWSAVLGLHHFYLGKWQRGVFDILAMCLGLYLLFYLESWLGLAIIIIIFIFELWQLFRSQVIIRDWNNTIYRHILIEILNKHTSSHTLKIDE